MTEPAKFEFTIPTQPISWNRAFRIVRVPHRGGGSHQQLAKTSDGWNFQMVVAALARQAAPRDWSPSGQVRVRYWFRLGRAIDADNVLKLLNDGIQHGTGVNDAVFLPCVEELTTGNKEPSVRVEVEG